jgi:hypothetical protein
VIRKPDILDKKMAIEEVPVTFIYKLRDRKYTTIEFDSNAPMLSMMDS